MADVRFVSELTDDEVWLDVNGGAACVGFGSTRLEAVQTAIDELEPALGVLFKERDRLKEQASPATRQRAQGGEEGTPDEHAHARYDSAPPPESVYDLPVEDSPYDDGEPAKPADVSTTEMTADEIKW